MSRGGHDMSEDQEKIPIQKFFRIVLIDPRVLLGMFKTDPDNQAWRCSNGLPEDVELIGWQNEPSGLIRLTVYSPQFGPEVRDEFNPEFTAYHFRGPVTDAVKLDCMQARAYEQEVI